MRSQIPIISKFIKPDKYYNIIKIQVCVTHHDKTFSLYI